MWETIRGISLILILSLFAIAYIENSSDLREKDIRWRWPKLDDKDKKEELKEDNKVEESEEEESEDDATEK
jgi:hypothetical protein